MQLGIGQSFGGKKPDPLFHTMCHSAFQMDKKFKCKTKHKNAEDRGGSIVMEAAGSV